MIIPQRVLSALASGALVYVVVVACSEDNVDRILSAMDGGAMKPTDGDLRMNPVPSAAAQPVDECRACQGVALRVTSAASDPTQLQSGEVTLPAVPRAAAGTWSGSTVKVVDGPFMVGTITSAELYTVPAAGSCSFEPAGQMDLTEGVQLERPQAEHHWLRENPSWSDPIVVLADQKLCARQDGNDSLDGARAARVLRFIGWRPYSN